jgi:hypothetical protein
MTSPGKTGKGSADISALSGNAARSGGGLVWAKADDDSVSQVASPIHALAFAMCRPMSLCPPRTMKAFCQRNVTFHLGKGASNPSQSGETFVLAEFEQSLLRQIGFPQSPTCNYPTSRA